MNFVDSCTFYDFPAQNPTLECSAKLSVTYAPAAVLGGGFEGNPAPGTAQGAVNEMLPTLLRYTPDAVFRTTCSKAGYNSLTTFYRVLIYQSTDSHISSPPLFLLFEYVAQFPLNIYKTSEDKEQF